MVWVDVIDIVFGVCCVVFVELGKLMGFKDGFFGLV